jgi:hypothetical protein
MDNIREFHNQHYLKPYCCKCYETDSTGLIGIFERVEPILSREEFLAIASDIFDLIYYKIDGRLVVDDIGTDSFMNYGLRIATSYNPYAFGPVILDYAEVYPLDGNKLFCNKVDPKTGMICGGALDHDGGYNNIICTKCGAHYDARELQLLEDKHEIIKKGISTNMKLQIKRGDTIIKEVDSRTMPTDTIEPPKKEKKHSSDQMSIINVALPRKKKHSNNTPSKRNNSVNQKKVNTGLGLNTMSRRSAACVTDVREGKSSVVNPRHIPVEEPEVEETTPEVIETEMPEVEETVEEVVTTEQEESIEDTVEVETTEESTDEVEFPGKNDLDQFAETTEEEYTDESESNDEVEFPGQHDEDQYDVEVTEEVHHTDEESEEEINPDDELGSDTSSDSDAVEEEEPFNAAFKDALARLIVKEESVKDENDEDASELSDPDEIETIIDDAMHNIKEEVKEDAEPMVPEDELGSVEYNTDTGFIPSNNSELNAEPVQQPINYNPFTV